MEIPKNAKKLDHKILRHGEHTGHKHEIAGVATCYDFGNDLIAASVPQNTTIVHEEHYRIMLPAGDYVTGGTNEYDHMLEESRRVAD